jgi:hypothetical protein
MLPSADSFTSPIEGYAPSVLQSKCDPKDKPGMQAFARLLLREVGGKAGLISRDCNQGGPSEHKEGRAFDWMVDVNKPDEKAMAEKVIAWLLAPDAAGNPHAMFRRAGLQYMIWDRRIWSVTHKDWVTYTGPHPHDNHIHFSMGWDGALGRTSLQQSLGVTPVPGPGPTPSAESHPWSLIAGIALGLGVVKAYGMLRGRR